MTTRNHQSSDMDPKEIRVHMLRSGVTQAGLARELDVHRSTVRQVIDGLTISDRVRRHIAAAISVPVERIWPSTYIYGKPRKPGRPVGVGTKQSQAVG